MTLQPPNDCIQAEAEAGESDAHVPNRSSVGRHAMIIIIIIIIIFQVGTLRT